jgi:hypothetical protein
MAFSYRLDPSNTSFASSFNIYLEPVGTAIGPRARHTYTATGASQPESDPSLTRGQVRAPAFVSQPAIATRPARPQTPTARYGTFLATATIETGLLHKNVRVQSLHCLQTHSRQVSIGGSAFDTRAYMTDGDNAQQSPRPLRPTERYASYLATAKTGAPALRPFPGVGEALPGFRTRGRHLSLSGAARGYQSIVPEGHHARAAPRPQSPAERYPSFLANPKFETALRPFNIGESLPLAPMHRRHVSLGGTAYGFRAAGDDGDRDLELPKLVQAMERYPSFVSVPNEGRTAIETGNLKPVPGQPGGVLLAAPAVRDQAGVSLRLGSPNARVYAGHQLRQASIARARHGGEVAVDIIPPFPDIRTAVPLVRSCLFLKEPVLAPGQVTDSNGKTGTMDCMSCSHIVPVGAPASMACHDGNKYPTRRLTHNTNSRVGKQETGSGFWTSSRIDEWLETTARHGNVCAAVLSSNGYCPPPPGKNHVPWSTGNYRINRAVAGRHN